MLINAPNLWLTKFPWLNHHDHKYIRGHILINGGIESCIGATKLAALAALRVGAGLVSIIVNNKTLPIYASSLTAVMTKIANNNKDYQKLITDKYVTSILIGPGSGVTKTTKLRVLTALKLNKDCILDADALTVFATDPGELFANIKANAILTPHEGEFKRLFTLTENRVESAILAAIKANAIIILKGPQTIIAAPDKRVIINQDSTPFLATAGSGDVLAGIIAGIVANKVSLFEAAAIGVWIHSQAAKKFGVGLIAEDLPQMVPEVLNDLYKIKPN